MSVSFPSEQPRLMEQFLLAIESGAYPTAVTQDTPRQSPVYSQASGLPTAQDWVLPGPGAEQEKVEDMRLESIRRLMPLWRW